MAKIYVKDKNDKWNEIDVGRCAELPIVVDWGGCTGDIISIDMGELRCDDDSPSFTVEHSSCTTQNIGGIVIDGIKLEAK